MIIRFCVSGAPPDKRGPIEFNYPPQQSLSLSSALPSIGALSYNDADGALSLATSGWLAGPQILSRHDAKSSEHFFYSPQNQFFLGKYTTSGTFPESGEHLTDE